MIKKFSYLLIIVLIIVARPTQAEEISEFTSLIKIAADGSVSVVERIGYDFGANAGYGIYRYLPVEAVEIEVPEYHFVKTQDKERIELKIGDGVQALSGLNFYGINYLLKKGVDYKDGTDEFHWNVNGNGWPVNIRLAKAELDLPKALPAEQVKAECYAGSLVTTSGCAELQLVRNGAGLVTGLMVAQKNLLPGESLSFVISWPKGVVERPGILEKIVDFLKSYYYIILAVIILSIVTLKWRKNIIKFLNLINN